MSRASQADAAKHREQVVTATSELLRERGAAGMSVGDVMSSAGLTHGGFYKHFGSKDELLGVATAAAFAELVDSLVRLNQTTDPLPGLLTDYLSKTHRDTPGTGCVNTGLAADAARAGADSPMRQAYAEGLSAAIEQITELHDPATRGQDEARRRGIEYLATMVGALTLARASAGAPISDEILKTVHTALTNRL
ncbi:TetR/AcrR family transcriptional regulator [Kribbella deserti]|uniref:TetR/AcrR family transcriptional regulator n=1 Tax=Kribbella deserti TaxID=1926257 RepID=A0ABV6QG18_9ACTN